MIKRIVSSFLNVNNDTSRDSLFLNFFATDFLRLIQYLQCVVSHNSSRYVVSRVQQGIHSVRQLRFILPSRIFALMYSPPRESFRLFLEAEAKEVIEEIMEKKDFTAETQEKIKKLAETFKKGF